MSYDYEKDIENARWLLAENVEWIKRYDGYADEITNNKDFLKSLRQQFNEWTPLRFYISTSQAKRSKTTLTLDVRYMGQNVALLTAKGNGSVTISTKGFDAKNKRDFCCDITLDGVTWRSDDAKCFRSYFKMTLPSRSKGGKGNEEHNVESILITEFSKKNSAVKLLQGIQPVRIAGIRFGMPTPVGACNHKKLKYSGPSGGGVDILARTGRGRGTYLTVIEVKDENKSDEPPQAALKQAIEYAVFIRELLRSKSGEKWWELFGFNGAIPKSLTIRCACAMPDDIPDKSFEREQYEITDDKDNDTIECHYIYFKMMNGKIETIDSSLDGTTKTK